MPVKSVREMNPFERKRNSLEARTFRATLMGCVILGLVLLIVGLVLFGVSLTKQYVSHAFYLAEEAAVPATHGAAATELAQEVMEIYRGLGEEERAKTGTPEYRALFSGAENSEAYDILIHMLPAYNRTDEVSDVYLAMYDEESCAMVYVVDPDEEERRLGREGHALRH